MGLNTLEMHQIGVSIFRIYQIDTIGGETLLHCCRIEGIDLEIDKKVQIRDSKLNLIDKVIITGFERGLYKESYELPDSSKYSIPGNTYTKNPDEEDMQFVYIRGISGEEIELEWYIFAEPEVENGEILIEAGLLKSENLASPGGAKIDSFLIQKYPVTLGQYFPFCIETGRKLILFKESRGNYMEMSFLPQDVYFKGDAVGSVAWYDAVEFCNWYSIQHGYTQCYTIDRSEKDKGNRCWQDKLCWRVKCDFSADGFRLPTELEWEFAASGGNISKNYKYSGSNDPLEVAVFITHQSVRESRKWKSREYSGSRWVGINRKPNELGIFDMSGNVWEWCWNWFQRGKLAVHKDLRRIDSGSARSKRGGGSSGPGKQLEVSSRGSAAPTQAHDQNGFRLVRSVIG